MWTQIVLINQSWYDDFIWKKKRRLVKFSMHPIGSINYKWSLSNKVRIYIYKRILWVETSHRDLLPQWTILCMLINQYYNKIIIIFFFRNNKGFSNFSKSKIKTSNENRICMKNKNNSDKKKIKLTRSTICSEEYYCPQVFEVNGIYLFRI